MIEATDTTGLSPRESKRREYYRDYRRKNIERLRAARKAEYARNRVDAIKKAKLWKLANPEAARRSSRRSYAKNKNKKAAYSKQYRQINREKCNAQTRSWQKANPEKSKECARRNRERNPDTLKRCKAAWNARNKERVAAYSKRYSREWHKRKRDTDIEFRILCSLRFHLWNSVKRQRESRNGRTLELLGCSIKFLIAHLESKFKPGMTWKNYGLWVIDHIKPCVSFKMSDPEQQRECFSWKNLQPLWEIDNLKKGSKILA